MSGASLSVRNVAKRFNGVTAVADLSFEVAAGSITGLIGPNGSGKTSTMNMITGLYGAEAGAIHLDSLDILGLPPFRIANLGVARTFQNIRLLPDQTVFDNVALGCHRSRSSGLLLRGSALAPARASCRTSGIDATKRSIGSASAISVGAEPAASPMAIGAASKSPGLSRCSPDCSSSTSRPPA